MHLLFFMIDFYLKPTLDLFQVLLWLKFYPLKGCSGYNYLKGVIKTTFTQYLTIITCPNEFDGPTAN